MHQHSKNELEHNMCDKNCQIYLVARNFKNVFFFPSLQLLFVYLEMSDNFTLYGQENIVLDNINLDRFGKSSFGKPSYIYLYFFKVKFLSVFDHGCINEYILAVKQEKETSQKKKQPVKCSKTYNFNNKPSKGSYKIKTFPKI